MGTERQKNDSTYQPGVVVDHQPWEPEEETERRRKRRHGRGGWRGPHPHVEVILDEAAPMVRVIPSARERGGWQAWGKHIAFGLSGILLFAFALGVMKAGAATLTPFIREQLNVTNAWDSLGLGWLMAWIVQSGSPVAALAMAMLSAETLSSAQGFTMIAGSRLGASFVVLQLGFLYALKEQDRRKSLVTGVLSLLLTASVLVISIPLGIALLKLGWFDDLQLPLLMHFGGIIGGGLDALVRPLEATLPGGVLFVLGIALVVAGFKLFDMALPDLNLERTNFGQINRIVYRPPFMFLMGLLLTFITMSVSISVGILVPLSVRGYLRRENIIAYIMGANVSTFFDTLVAAVVLGEPTGVTVVLIHMACAALISLLIVLFFYRQYESAISWALGWIIRRMFNFAIFLGIAFIIPFILMLL